MANYTFRFSDALISTKSIGELREAKETIAEEEMTAYSNYNAYIGCEEEVASYWHSRYQMAKALRIQIEEEILKRDTDLTMVPLV